MLRIFYTYPIVNNLIIDKHCLSRIIILWIKQIKKKKLLVTSTYLVLTSSYFSYFFRILKTTMEIITIYLKY